MTGIKSYSAYVPFHRLKKSAVAAAFGNAPKKGEKAVAYYDEDSLTMAVAASMEAMKSQDVAKLGACYFASTTAPYGEKQCATQIAACLDAADEVRTADFSGSLRCGADAMMAAIEFAKNGKDAVVAVGDCRLGAADGQYELDLGDGAAAFVFGSENVIAEIKGTFAVARDIHDMWRCDDERFVRFWDIRFANTSYYEPLVKKAVKGLLAETGMTPADFSKIVIYAHEDRHRAGLAAKLGFTPEQLPKNLFNEIGNTGAAAAPQSLCAALDEAKPGDNILYVSYGDGCEAIALTVTDAIATYPRRDTVAAKIARKNDDLPYGKYLKWKDMIQCEPQRRPDVERSSLPDYYRNYKKNTAFIGSICTKCGTPHMPAQRVCARCHAIDQMEPYRFIDKKATLRTFTLDGLSLSKDSPNILAVVDFEGGGKLLTYLVDCKKEDIRVGMGLEFSYREILKANGVHTYFWKVVPAIEKEAK